MMRCCHWSACKNLPYRGFAWCEEHLLAAARDASRHAYPELARHDLYWLRETGLITKLSKEEVDALSARARSRTKLQPGLTHRRKEWPR